MGRGQSLNATRRNAALVVRRRWAGRLGMGAATSRRGGGGRGKKPKGPRDGSQGSAKVGEGDLKPGCFSEDGDVRVEQASVFEIGLVKNKVETDFKVAYWREKTKRRSLLDGKLVCERSRMPSWRVNCPRLAGLVYRGCPRVACRGRICCSKGRIRSERGSKVEQIGRSSGRERL